MISKSLFKCWVDEHTKKCMLRIWGAGLDVLSSLRHCLKSLWSSLFMAIAHRAIAMNGVRDPYVVRMPNGLSLSLAFNINSHAHCISRTVKYSNWWGLQFVFINIKYTHFLNHMHEYILLYTYLILCYYRKQIFFFSVVINTTLRSAVFWKLQRFFSFNNIWFVNWQNLEYIGRLSQPLANGHYNTESEKSSGLHIVKVKHVNFL